MRKRIAVGTIAGLAAAMLIISVVLFTCVPHYFSANEFDLAAKVYGGNGWGYNFGIRPYNNVNYNSIQVACYDKNGNEILGTPNMEFVEISEKASITIHVIGLLKGAKKEKPSFRIHVYVIGEPPRKIPIIINLIDLEGQKKSIRYELDMYQKPLVTIK